MRPALLSAVTILFVFSSLAADSVPFPPAAGPLMKQGDDFFPIAVWLQSPRNAAKYKAAGINLYVGLWRGPTEDQLKELKAAGMPVVCAQNQVALNSPDRDIIFGWMHGDEPDNAQSKGRGQGYGPPILPEKIQADYQRIRQTDKEGKPVLLNLGQGVAWDNYIGRGVRNHPEDYAEYLKGCDIGSFDIYPVVHDNKEIAGKLEMVAFGVSLRTWTGGKKPVFACIECTHISNPDAKANPEQIRSEVWMALIQGAQGIIYFVHEFKPASNEAKLLGDPENLAAVTEINKQITELAPVLNSRQTVEGLKVTAVDDVSIATLTRKHAGATYVFAVSMRPADATVTFQLPNVKGLKPVDPLGEGRMIASRDGKWTDQFKGYGVHLYKVTQ